MPITRKKTIQPTYILLFHLGLSLSLLMPRAQGPGGIQGNIRGGFEWSMPDKDNQISTSIQGDSMEGDLLKGVSIKFFSGSQRLTPSFVIEAPACTLDQQTLDAHSSGPITLRSGDAGIAIQGMGWRWIQDAAELTISNKVSTLIKRAFLSRASTQGLEEDDQSISVESGRLIFDRYRGEARFDKGVKVIDPDRLQLNGQNLALSLVSGSTDIQEINASGEVRLQSLNPKLPISATGGRAIYSQPASDSPKLELLDEPYWNLKGKAHGRGDLIRIRGMEKANHHLEVIGQALLTLSEPPQLGLSSVEPNQPNVAEQPIQIESQTYALKGNELVFENAVSVHQAGNWVMSCNQLRTSVESQVASPKQDSSQIPQPIEAIGEVSWTTFKATNSLKAKANRALLTPGLKGHFKLTMEGSARIESAQYLASATRLVLEKQGDREALHARGQASLELSQGAVDENIQLFAPSRASSQGSMKGSSNLQIVSDQYSFENGKGLFDGQVRLRWNTLQMTCQELETLVDPATKTMQALTASDNVILQQDQGVLSCETILGSFSKEIGKLETLVAEGGVRIQHPNGQAAGQQAVFHTRTQLIELKGEPWILAKLEAAPGQSKRHVLAEGGRLFWNQTRNRLSGRGDYHITTVDNPEAISHGG